MNDAAPAKPADGVNRIVPAASVTVPDVGAPTAVTDNTSPSTSESLASTAATGRLSSVLAGVVAVSFTATGASLTGVTSTVTVASDWSPPSDTTYLKVSTPLKFGAGTYSTTSPSVDVVP